MLSKFVGFLIGFVGSMPLIILVFYGSGVSPSGLGWLISMIAIGSFTARLFSSPRQVGERFNPGVGLIDSKICDHQALYEVTPSALVPVWRTPTAVGNRGIRPTHFTRTRKKNLSIERSDTQPFFSDA